MTSIPAGQNRLTTTSQRAAAASVSAQARRIRAICPGCGMKSVERVPPSFGTLIPPLGMCHVRCGKCSYTAIVETKGWAS